MVSLVLALHAILFQSPQASVHPAPVPAPTEVSTLVDRARSARYQQDSALGRYEALARQRMSARIGLARNLGVGPIAPERLAARFESVARVGWDYSLGAWGELIGARSVVPLLGITEPEGDDEDVALVLPYHPGRDQLWPIGELREAMPKAAAFIEHPLAAGADSLYVFSLGDSLRIMLPNGSPVRLREIRVRARRPDSRLIVGSLWVDISSGNLVRAAYRPSTPMDLWPFMERDINKNDRSKVQKLGPFTGTVREIIVEHGLYEGRFWLPRTRIASAEGTAKGARVSLSIEQTFEYQHVSAMSPNSTAEPYKMPVSIDPRTGRERYQYWQGVQRRSRACRRAADSTAARWSPDSLLHNDSLSVMYASGIRFRVLLPCNRSSLATSPMLPGSIYDSGEALFATTDLNALRADAEKAIGLSAQAEYKPQPIAFHYGLENGQLRYNRVEGLSVGVMGERELGRGYTESGMLRIGTADLQPNAEVSLKRSNGRRDVSGTLYRRLSATNDWEDPLGIGASLAAALFSRDDGFYYRTLGAELNGTRRSADEGPVFTWRLFGEREDSAPVKTYRSLANTINGNRFVPNIQARAGMYYGGSAGLGFAWGTDPTGTRLSGGSRLEAATGESSFARFSTEIAASHGLGGGTQASLTASGGASVGSVPVQRLWYLGGAHTVRGHAPGAAVGDAYWFGRAELAKGHPLVRPAVFADIGWAGDRTSWLEPGRPLAGAGVGAAFLDGLVRLDFARGLERGGGWRADFYLEVR
jgi:hypothetical protein